MKKVFLVILLVFLICLCFSTIALADDGMDASSFFTWDRIGTFSGAVALVVFVVQVLKLPLDKVWHIPTQYVVYVVSLAVLLLAQAFVPALGGLTFQNGILCVFNAVLVALAAMSTYSIAIEGPELEKLSTVSLDVTIEKTENGDAVVVKDMDGETIATL